MVIRGRQRSTPDVIVLVLSGVVGIVVVGSAFVFFYALLSPAHEEGLSQVAEQVSSMTDGLIALIVGYVGGRGAAAMTDSDKKKPPEE